MTIEEIQTEKNLLEEKIYEAIREFHKATGFWPSGRFYSQRFFEGGLERNVAEPPFRPAVIINPIEI